MPVVKKITALETYTVRQEVLRKGKPIEIPLGRTVQEAGSHGQN